MQRGMRTGRIPKDGTLASDVVSGIPLRARRVTFREFIQLESAAMIFVQSRQPLKSGRTLDIERDCPYYVMHRDRVRPVRKNSSMDPDRVWHWSVNMPKELALYVTEIATRLKDRASKLGTPSAKTVSALIVVIASAMQYGSESIFQNKLSGCIPRSRFVCVHANFLLMPSAASRLVCLPLQSPAYCLTCM